MNPIVHEIDLSDIHGGVKKEEPVGVKDDSSLNVDPYIIFVPPSIEVLDSLTKALALCGESFMVSPKNSPDDILENGWIVALGGHQDE